MKKALGKGTALAVSILMASTLLFGCGGNSAATTAAGKVSAAADKTAAGSTAASGVSGNKTADGKTVIKVGINSDPASFGPFEAGGNGKNATYATLYEPLAEYQGVGGEVKGVAAKDWKQETDKKVWDLNLYENVKDTAGNPFTADDCVWMLQQMKDSGNFGDLKYMVSAEKTGDYSVKITLNSDVVGLFAKILQGTRVVTKKSYEASPDKMSKDPVGTSHYKLANYVSGSEYDFEKTDNYWQTDQSKWDMYQYANVDKIEYFYIPEDSQLAIALESGTVDMVCGLSYTESKRFMEGGQDAAKFNVYQDLQNLSQVLFFQCSSNSPCSNEKLRQAILYGIDINGLIQGAASGQGVACATFGGNMFSDYNKDWESKPYYTYNVEKAKALVKESGYDASKKLKIVLNGNSVRKSIAQIMQGYLTQIGINCEIDSYEDSLFNTYKMDDTAYDILLDNCGGSDYLMTIWRGKFDNTQYKTGETINGLKDDQAQKLIVACETTHTQDDMNAFHSYLYEHAIAAGLFNAQMFTVTTKACTGITLDGKQFLNVASSKYSWN